MSGRERNALRRRNEAHRLVRASESQQPEPDNQVTAPVSPPSLSDRPPTTATRLVVNHDFDAIDASGALASEESLRLDGLESGDGSAVDEVEEDDADIADAEVDSEAESRDEHEGNRPPGPIPEPGLHEGQRELVEVAPGCSRGRDLSRLDEFDWNWASSFAMHPTAVSSLRKSDRASITGFSHRGITRAIWDSVVKPIVDSVVGELGGNDNQKLNSHKATARRIAKLFPGIEPTYVDSCVDGCCVFNSERRREDACPHCGTPRLNGANQPLRRTAVFPLRRMLQSLLSHHDRAKVMVEYRAQFDGSPTSVLRDFWDGEEARKMMQPGGLLERNTTVALTITGDGAEYSKSPKRSITPYMALVQNIPPSTRYRQELPLAIHYGEAKDDSVWQAIFNAIESEQIETLTPRGLGLFYGEHEFDYVFCMGTGDYPFAAASLGLVNQTGRMACRICNATGLRAERGYYMVDKIPSDAPILQNGSYRVTPVGHSSRTKRTREQYYDAIQSHRNATTEEARKRVRFLTGVKVTQGPTEFVKRLPEHLPFHRLVPIDPMHAIPLNVLKHMLQMVTDHQKKYNSLPFCLSKDHISGFLQDLVSCNPHIPEELMRRPLVDFTKCTARSEHYLAIGRLLPVLLKGRLPPQYLHAFVHLKGIMDRMAELQFTDEDVQGLETCITKFQKEFYGNWYAGIYDRVPLCKTYFHGICHIPDAIRAWGPPFVFAQWSMERLNGKATVMARRNPTMPVQTTANLLATGLRVSAFRDDDGQKEPVRGLSNRLPQRKWAFRQGEKQALSSFLDIPLSSLEVDEVVRFKDFCFTSEQTGKSQKARGTYCRNQSSKKESCYAFAAESNAYVRVISFFRYQDRNLAFVNLLPLDKVKIDEFFNEYCSWTDWRQRTSVIEASKISHLVGLVENRCTPGKAYMVRSLRVYNGYVHALE